VHEQGGSRPASRRGEAAVTVSWLLVADAADKAKSVALEPCLLWRTVALVAAILIGALVIAVFERWRKRPVNFRPDPNDQLAEFRSLYDRGEISREEFDRIRNLLGERLREALDVPATQPNSPPPTPPEPPAPPTSGSPGS